MKWQTQNEGALVDAGTRQVPQAEVPAGRKAKCVLVIHCSVGNSGEVSSEEIGIVSRDFLN